MCIKGLDGSNHAVRMEIAKLLGFVMAKTQLDSPATGINGNAGQSPINTSTGGALTSELFFILSQFFFFLELLSFHPF